MANGLINLQTDLKSLRYGSDKPYITKNIGDAPGSQIGLEVQTRIDDTSRIAQMLIDKPGIKYLLNEALLQQINIDDKIRNRGNKTVAGAVLGQLGNTLVGTAKILGSTLAQVPVNGTGLHFLKGFRTDTYLQPTNGNPASGFAQFFGAGGVEGAPLALQGKPIEGEAESNFGTKVSPTEFKVTRKSSFDYDDYLNSPIPKDSEQGVTKEYAQQGKVIPISGSSIQTTIAQGELGITNQNVTGSNDNLNKYLAESGSVINISGSVIETTLAFGSEGISNQNVTGSNDNLNSQKAKEGKRIFVGQKQEDYYITPSAYQKTDGSNITIEGQKITAGEKSIPKITELSTLRTDINSGSVEIAYRDGDVVDYSPKLQDFRQGGDTFYSFDYNNAQIKRETRVNLGDQGKLKPSGFYTSYSNVDPDAVDKLNALDISNTRIDGTQAARDLAKLYFEIITPDGSKFLHFRAFIDSIDDNYNADWQGSKYVGRAENFYTYGGFERDITISFKIAAATRSEMKPLYKKMVYLASSTAPTYGGQGFMRGSLARITVGSYLSQIPGVITSVKFSLIDGMPWEIAMQNPEAGTDDDVQELPMGLQCSISFKAIHDFAPQTGLQHYFTNPNPVNGSQPFF